MRLVDYRILVAYYVPVGTDRTAALLAVLSWRWVWCKRSLRATFENAWVKTY